MMNQTASKSAANSSTEKEMISMAEEELSRLQRQLRIMEDDRLAFSDETSLKLEKQRKIINQLKVEKSKLSEDIKIATCRNQKRRDEKLTKEVYKLLDVHEEFSQSIKLKKEEIVEMDVQIKKLENDIKRLRPKSAVTENHFQSRLKSGKKILQILKNRLDNVVKKFCAILAVNKDLREEINHLLKERNHFNEVWEKLLKDIDNGKKFMIDLIEQATIAFDQREEWCSKLEALKKRADLDFILHSEEMREVQRKLDHYMALREFLCVKGQKRILKDVEEKERLKKEMQDQELENQMKLYNDILKEIQEFCDEDDVERIAILFHKQEEENFALFNYVNELGHEIENLNKTIEEIHRKIDEQVEISNEKAKEHKITLCTLKSDLDSAIEEAKEEENKLKETNINLNHTLKGIEELFDLLKCERGPILKLVGNDAAINLFNVNIYLGCIEKKISTIVTQLYFAEKSVCSIFN